MFRHRTGTAGSAAGATAAARYFLGETLRQENAVLARYYAGDAMPPPLTRSDVLGRAIAEGVGSFREAADDLVSAHDRLAGSPGHVETLEDRIGAILSKAETREADADRGGIVARMREDLDPRLAQRLGIDTTRPVTQDALAHLLAGARADGRAVEGKQIQRPMKSVAEIFGLDTAAPPGPGVIDHLLAGRRADGTVPRSGAGEALPDTMIEGARKRFLAAYGLPGHTELTPEHIEHIKAGRSATGRLLDTGDVLRRLTATNHPISYTDCIWSADKSVTLAWALAPTEAERALILQAHRDAVATSMAYLETHLGFARKGKNGLGGVEPGVCAWVVCDHYTSRPTAEIAAIDKHGEAYTEFQDLFVDSPSQFGPVPIATVGWIVCDAQRAEHPV